MLKQQQSITDDKITVIPSGKTLSKRKIQRNKEEHIIELYNSF